MAVDKVSDGKSVSIRYFKVTNRANCPREFQFRGKWYRWEPSGREGDFVVLNRDVVLSEEFKLYAKYFNVSEVDK